MADPIAHVNVPSKTRPGAHHEVTLWRHPSGHMSSTCTCEHQLFSRDPRSRCTHRRHVEQRLFEAGFKSAPGGRIATPEDAKASWAAFWAPRIAAERAGRAPN